MSSQETQPLFDASKRLGVGFYLGCVELEVDEQESGMKHFNTSILVDPNGHIIGKYQKYTFRGMPITGTNGYSACGEALL